MPAAEIGGYHAHWVKMGQGPRPVLALHCSLARGRAWAPLVAELSDLVSVTALDLPGHGSSDDWDPAVPYLDQVMPMIDHLARVGPVDLFGHSFGAVLALAFAAQNPERVASLSLFEPVFFAAAEGRPECAENTRSFVPFATAMEAGDAEAATRAFTGVWGGSTPWEAIPAAQRAYMTERIHLIPAGDPVLYQDAAGILDAGRLERLEGPVLLMEGSTSPAIIPAILEELAARLPNVRRAVIPEAGHMAPLTRPAVVAAEIRAFLSGPAHRL